MRGNSRKLYIVIFNSYITTWSGHKHGKWEAACSAAFVLTLVGSFGLSSGQAGDTEPNELLRKGKQVEIDLIETETSTFQTKSRSNSFFFARKRQTRNERYKFV